MRRILFVDDEPKILDGLRRLLRPYREEWSLAFAECGIDALIRLDAEPFDVVVTDMRMPGMDGAQLLELIRDRFPGVVRIVLSGYFDAEAALRAAPVAHQFLLKPCDLQKLRQAIESSFAIDAVLSDEGVRRAVTAVGALPSIPETCNELIRALEAPEGSTDEIGRIVANDVGIAAKVLQLASSAVVGAAEPITTIDMAVSCLGLEALRHLLLSVELFQTFQPVRKLEGFTLESFQHHSRLVVEVARILPASEAARTHSVMAALLHDVGKLVLASRFPDQFEAALKQSEEHGQPLWVAEEVLMGISHAQVGAYLMGLWGVAPEIVRAVAQHHRATPPNTGGMEGLDTEAVVYIADALVHDWRSRREPVTGGGPRIDHLATLRGVPQLPVWLEAADATIQEIEATRLVQV